MILLYVINFNETRSVLDSKPVTINDCWPVFQLFESIRITRTIRYSGFQTPVILYVPNVVYYSPRPQFIGHLDASRTLCELEEFTFGSNNKFNVQC